MATKTVKQPTGERNAPSGDDLRFAYQTHTLAQMLYGQMATARPWTPSGPWSGAAHPFVGPGPGYVEAHPFVERPLGVEPMPAQNWWPMWGQPFGWFR